VRCGTRCEPVESEAVAAEPSIREQSFFQALPGAFGYPFRKDGAILLIAGAVLLIRYGHVRYPYSEDATRHGSALPNFGKE